MKYFTPVREVNCTTYVPALDARTAGTVNVPLESDFIDPSETNFPPMTIVAFIVAFFGNDFTTGAIV